MEEQDLPAPEEKFLTKHRTMICLILFLVTGIFYNNYKADEVEKHGVITIAKVIEDEMAEQGSSLKIQVYWKDKLITTTVTDRYFCEGKYYFVKVLKDDPDDDPLIYMDKPVPDCIIENVKYFNGWKDFPTCDNFK